MKSGVKPKNVKDSNVRFAMDIIRKGGIVSVSDISGEIRLSKTTVKKMIDLLVCGGFVMSTGKGESTDEGGKRPELYQFNSCSGYVVSAHITPDSIIAATVDLNADVLEREEYSIVSKRDFNFILKKLLAMVVSLITERAKRNGKLIGFSIALPGLVDSTKGLSIYSPHFPLWGRDLPFADLFKEGLSGLLPSTSEAPVFVDCTNRFQAVAEREKGCAKGVDNFIIIDALAEGLGAGIVLNGKVKHGAQSLSGEVGHLTLDSLNGPECICGNKGCFEALVSEKRIAGTARELLKSWPETVLNRGKAPDEITLGDICVGASAGDEFCRKLVREAAHWFVVGLGNIIMVNDPEMIIIQGEYLKAGSFFLDLLREGIGHIGLPDVEKTVQIEFSGMDENRGIMGGAAVVINDFFAARSYF